MDHIFEVIVRALPVFLMIALGMVLRRTGTLSEKTIPEIKKLIVHVTLPSMLLITFAKTQFRAEYALIFLIMFAFCCLMLTFGVLVSPKISKENRFFPALFTGFEAGMMGYALFTTFFGKENNYAFAIVDIGQVLFVFFILVLFLRKRSGSEASFGVLIRGFILSPIILSIILGIVLGSTGIYQYMLGFAVTGAVEETLGLLGAMTQPLICLVIGFDLRLRFSRMHKSLAVIGIRLAIMLVAAFLLNTLVVDGILHLDPIFHIAVYTMFLLPPPFVIPVYFGKASSIEKEEILDALSLHIIVSLVAFIVLLAVTQ
ncbi:MAG: hypothetical protein JW780_02215 [Clostridiales bacterium]|nr:hypothetical protein [Clostridiales bacterium]